MKKYFYPIGSVCFLILTGLYPADALDAALQSLSVWARSVVPALLPYLVVCPALTSPEMTRFLSRFLNGLTRAMRLPSSACGAVFIGFLSGSPAGAAALASARPDSSAPSGATLRAALLASGASPAFLLTGVAVTMLNQPEAGWILIRSQILSVFVSGLILRRFGSDRPVSETKSRRAEDGTVLRAALTLLVVGGYMTLFSVVARLLSRLLGDAWETPILAVAELSGGCKAVAALPVSPELRLPLISAIACFGGISVYTQCLSFLKPLGVDPIEYGAGKLIQSAVCALFTFVQITLPKINIDPVLTGFLTICCLLVAFMFRGMFRRRAPSEEVESAP